MFGNFAVFLHEVKNAYLFKVCLKAGLFAIVYKSHKHKGPSWIQVTSWPWLYFNKLSWLHLSRIIMLWSFRSERCLHTVDNNRYLFYSLCGLPLFFRKNLRKFALTTTCFSIWRATHLSITSAVKSSPSTTQQRSFVGSYWKLEGWEEAGGWVSFLNSTQLPAMFLYG